MIKHTHTIRVFDHVNVFQASDPHLYPLKTSEPKVKRGKKS